MLRRLLRNRFLLPAAVLLTVGLGSVLGLASGASASGSHSSASVILTSTTSYSSSSTSSTSATATTGTATSTTATAQCAAEANKIGYKSPATSGSPSSSDASLLKCTTGKVTQYGSKAIVYSVPPSSYIKPGRALFEQYCSSCHLPTASGSAAAPSLRGVGPAAVNFWVTTGRMPAATPLQIEAERKPARLTVHQADEIAAFINSLAPAAPFIPKVNEKDANLADGASLFALNCAACHTITGAGDALAFGTNAPSIQNRQVTPQQVAEAMRIGPANMPRFSGNMTDPEVRDVVAYVTEDIQHPANPGGAGLGGVGPVAEGFVALLIGVGGLVLVCFWIGERS